MLKKIMLAGMGSIGQRHFRNLRTLGYEDIVLYRTGKAQLENDGLKHFPTEIDLDKALSHKPDAVIICNPTALHLDVAIPAAHAGCHLFIEKPISHSLDGCNQLQKIAKKRKLITMIGFQFRFHPALMEIKKLIERNTIGRVISARAHWGEYLPDCHPWEDYKTSYASKVELGGGVILTFCHPVDYLRWMLGEIRSVSALESPIHSLGLPVEEAAILSLSFQSGAIGSVYLDYVQRPPAHRLEIVGETGCLCWDSKDNSVRYYEAMNGRWNEFMTPRDFERNTMFMDEMKHFIECVNNGRETIIPLSDGIQVLKVLLEAKHNRIPMLG